VEKLEKWKSNQVFKAIEAAGLNPAEFDWDNSAADICIRHRSSESYFDFGGVAGQYIVRYATGDEPATQLAKYTWEALMASVELWLADVKRDTETVDLWAQLRQGTDLLEGAWAEAVDNTPFSSDERNDIARRLDELSAHVKSTYALSERQLSQFDARLEYLVGASDRLGRKDWLILFIGIVAEFVLVAVLPPEVARNVILSFLDDIVRWLGHGYWQLGSG
jgi:hypothetical protein